MRLSQAREREEGWQGMEIKKEMKLSKFGKICVFCGSSHGKKQSYQDATVELGKELTLIQKGVSKVEAEKATKQVFEDDDLNGNDYSSKFGMSKLATDHLFLDTLKQWLRGKETPLEKHNARIVRWLHYCGFNWGGTSYILKKLQSKFPP